MLVLGVKDEQWIQVGESFIMVRRKGTKASTIHFLCPDHVTVKRNANKGAGDFMAKQKKKPRYTPPFLKT